jgi:hypothetical protein
LTCAEVGEILESLENTGDGEVRSDVYDLSQEDLQGLSSETVWKFKQNSLFLLHRNPDYLHPSKHASAKLESANPFATQFPSYEILPHLMPYLLLKLSEYPSKTIEILCHLLSHKPTQIYMISTNSYQKLISEITENPKNFTAFTEKFRSNFKFSKLKL